MDVWVVVVGLRQLVNGGFFQETEEKWIIDDSVPRLKGKSEKLTKEEGRQGFGLTKRVKATSKPTIFPSPAPH